MKLRELKFEDRKNSKGVEWTTVWIGNTILFNIEKEVFWNGTSVYHIVFGIGPIPKTLFGMIPEYDVKLCESTTFHTLDAAKEECKKIIEKFVKIFVE